MPYLSPQAPRWALRDEEDLATAAAKGLLEETHYLDLKELIPPGSAKNRELGRDLASFAVDGGTMLVGVREVDDGPPQLTLS
jgi:hypothetical protein